MGQHDIFSITYRVLGVRRATRVVDHRQVGGSDVIPPVYQEETDSRRCACQCGRMAARSLQSIAHYAGGVLSQQGNLRKIHSNHCNNVTTTHKNTFIKKSYSASTTCVSSDSSVVTKESAIGYFCYRIVTTCVKRDVHKTTKQRD